MNPKTKLEIGYLKWIKAVKSYTQTHGGNK